MEIALIGFVVMLIFLFLRVPIAFSLAVVGCIGFAYIVGREPAQEMVGQVLYDSVLNYGFSVVPLFILMGNFVTQARLSQELYEAADAFIGYRRGGLAMATVLACGGFSAVSGSSLATAATMAKVAMPSMRSYGYSDKLSAGSVAAGGTLGILIPPSVILVLYGIITDNDIGQLFIAGIVPGIVSIVSYFIVITIITHVRPEMGPPGARKNWSDRLYSLRGVWGVLLLFFIVLGGIYFGVFTPTEAGGIGAGGAFLFALSRRTLDFFSIFKALIDTARTTAMIFTILFGGIIFSNFINVAELPTAMVSLVNELKLTPFNIMLSILVIYLILGCILDTLGMLFLTIPVFYPLIVGVGFDPIWFGIIVVVVSEIALITPPIGLNVYMLNSLLPDIPLNVMFLGILPFLAADLVRLALLVLFPGIVTFLPYMMK
jgi:tripartite ATP-independent transporter DctM subunit